jgi:radical SAM protein with 4Fe4S-binding SPASM domain
VSSPDFAFPRKIQIQTHNRCNFACSMCPYEAAATSSSRVQMDKDLLRKIIGEVAAENEHVELCLMLQNEPLLDRRFLDFLDDAHSAVSVVDSVSTVTNGSTLTAELLDQLVGYERFKLTISVNATERSRYRSVHGRDLWDRLADLLTGWRGPRDRVRVSFVLDDDSVDEARTFDRHWRQAGYRTRLVPMNSRVDSLDGERGFSTVEADFGFCHYPVDTLTVLADGNIILCCNDWLHKTTYGNVRTASISSLWNQPALRRLRSAAVEGTLREASPMCRNCDYPMRSSTRVRLEALLSESGASPSSGSGTAGHWSEVEFDAGARVAPLWVSEIVPDAGVVGGLLSGSLHSPSSRQVRFEFRIGHEGLFDFGGLGTRWCAGELYQIDPATQHGQTPVLIELDRTAPEFRLFNWYAEDWRIKAPVPQIQGSRRKESQ